VTEEQARASIHGLLQITDQLHSTQRLVPRTFQIANQFNQRIYDCFYVTVAERQAMSFWTGDERLFNALHTALPFVRFIADYTPVR
jgi:predicted nucleic acid-binding protein